MGAPQFTQSHTALSMTTCVAVDIMAPAGTVWSILTDAKGFPRWNSTVSGIDGEIREGERITVHAPGTTRRFKPTISDFTPGKRMTWASE
jgi:uncharacterized protein YndB with AHSA1/START domain